MQEPAVQHSRESTHHTTKSLTDPPPACLVLFSGGLDSILACKVLQEQGIRVTALRFITPFFGYELKGREDEAREKVRKSYGIDMEIVDISEPYLEMLRTPEHGYGRYFNPCIDCKILMLRKAVEMLDRFGASFIATGEVIGQRPMSQRRDTLLAIEKKSGASGLLLRPLCAQRLAPTQAEKTGLVDRSRLLALSGRGRKEQIALAEKYGIKDYPTPAGGCVLADPVLSRRFRRILELWKDVDTNDCLLVQVGRQFLLPDGSWLVIGRDEAENGKLSRLKKSGDMIFLMTDRPGPTGLLRRGGTDTDPELAAEILSRYAKPKDEPKKLKITDDNIQMFLEAEPADEEVIERYRL